MKYPSLRNYTETLIYLILYGDRHVCLHPSSERRRLVSEVKQGKVIDASHVGGDDYRITIHEEVWPHIDRYPERSKCDAYVMRERDARVLAYHGRIDDIYYIPDSEFAMPQCIVKRLWQIPKH